MHVHTPFVCLVYLEARRDVKAPGTRVVGSYEPPNVGARYQISVLCKSSK